MLVVAEVQLLPTVCPEFLDFRDLSQLFRAIPAGERLHKSSAELRYIISANKST